MMATIIVITRRHNDRLIITKGPSKKPQLALGGEWFTQTAWDPKSLVVGDIAGLPRRLWLFLQLRGSFQRARAPLKGSCLGLILVRADRIIGTL